MPDIFRVKSWQILRKAWHRHGFAWQIMKISEIQQISWFLGQKTRIINRNWKIFVHFRLILQKFRRCAARNTVFHREFMKNAGKIEENFPNRSSKSWQFFKIRWFWATRRLAAKSWKLKKTMLKSYYRVFGYATRLSLQACCIPFEPPWNGGFSRDISIILEIFEKICKL